MFNLIKVELNKLKTSKTLYLCVFLNLLQSILVYTFSDKLQLMGGKESLFYLLGIQGALALNILIGIFVSDHIVIEFTSGYIKNFISYGHKRINIFVSKIIACYVGTMIITFMPPLIISGINSKINGYGEVFCFNSLIFLLKTILIMIIIYISIASVFVLIAFVCKNINISIIIVVGLDFMNRIFEIMSVQKPSLRWIAGKFIFGQSTIMLSDKVTRGEILQAVIMGIVTIIITTLVGIYVFKNSDIK
ncbi:ABC transporter permease subunit [Clostridium sp. P21]|uniref:ABC transporter permease subunit n=1 Tax=Clostridium muellerianum TaxID=2716538 RepID=A0A7Y0HP80_9CLOT|nr:ABC transporter permease [Clostridium muellerianum]NMM63452.1 ABC transporter permease subunit [Clostridium muellerianum]